MLELAVPRAVAYSDGTRSLMLAHRPALLCRKNWKVQWLSELFQIWKAKAWESRQPLAGATTHHFSISNLLIIRQSKGGRWAIRNDRGAIALTFDHYQSFESFPKTQNLCSRSLRIISQFLRLVAHLHLYLPKVHLATSHKVCHYESYVRWWPIVRSYLL